jgi:hypothetical protein
MQVMMKILDEAEQTQAIKDDRLEIIEICLTSIKQLANTKQTFKEFLSFSPRNRELLT